MRTRTINYFPLGVVEVKPGETARIAKAPDVDFLGNLLIISGPPLVERPAVMSLVVRVARALLLHGVVDRLAKRRQRKNLRGLFVQQILIDGKEQMMNEPDFPGLPCAVFGSFSPAAYLSLPVASAGKEIALLVRNTSEETKRVSVTFLGEAKKPGPVATPSGVVYYTGS